MQKDSFGAIAGAVYDHTSQDRMNGERRMARCKGLNEVDAM